MLSCIKGQGITSRKKLFRAEFQKTYTQMTSFLPPLHDASLCQNVTVNIPFKF